MTEQRQVTVLRNRLVQGGSSGGVVTAPLAVALVRRFAGDAHFQAATSSLGVRLTAAAIGTAPISIGVVAFDVDCPEMHGTPEPAPQPWREELTAKIAKLAAVHPGPFVYSTRGGARIVYLLPEPFTIASADDAAVWTARYLAGCDELGRIAALQADRSCADWQRLHRLPCATRTAGGTPEAWPVIGDPNGIGVMALPPASPVQKKHTPAPAEPKARPQRLDPDDGELRGALYEACTAAGLIIRPGPVPRSFIVKCPRESSHSVGRAGDGSTLLHLPSGPAWLGGPGSIHCKHHGCAAMRSAKQWRRAIAALGGASRRGCVTTQPLVPTE